jgi:beta-glucosidase
VKKFDFPEGFTWGVATASYQVEGAVREGGRGETIWDRFSHTPGSVANGDTGDIACDQYHRYPEDITLMQALGIGAYRFSIAWSRIFPDATDAPNAEGLAYYDRLVDALLAAGIEPFPTLYHWDLPQWLQETGGWADRRIIGRFASYAETMVDALGDRVRHWMVLNEPWEFVTLGMLTGDHAPGHRDRDEALRASHIVNLSHAEAIRAMRSSGRQLDIGTAFSLEPAYPVSQRPEDLAAAQRRDAFKHGWYLDPMLRGEYPVAYLDQAAALDRMAILEGDMERVRADLDFIGVNLYDRGVVAASADDPIHGLRMVRGPGPRTAIDWEVWPAAMYRALCDLDRRYGHLPMYVTENGCSYPAGPDPDGRVRDPERIEYLRGHIGQMARAMAEGCDVRGYFAWSLLDNFEWATGYTHRFGIVHCDFANDLRRTIKDSGYWYRDLIASGRVDYDAILA